MATDPQLILEEQDRQKLDGIVSKMKANNEPDDKIRFVVNDFKSKYGVKKKDKPQGLAEALGAAQEAPSQEESGAGSPQESSDQPSVATREQTVGTPLNPVQPKEEEPTGRVRLDQFQELALEDANKRVIKKIQQDPEFITQAKTLSEHAAQKATAEVTELVKSGRVSADQDPNALFRERAQEIFRELMDTDEKIQGVSDKYAPIFQQEYQKNIDSYLKIEGEKQERGMERGLETVLTGLRVPFAEKMASGIVGTSFGKALMETVSATIPKEYQAVELSQEVNRLQALSQALNEKPEEENKTGRKGVEVTGRRPKLVQSLRSVYNDDEIKEEIDETLGDIGLSLNKIKEYDQVIQSSNLERDLIAASQEGIGEFTKTLGALLGDQVARLPSMAVGGSFVAEIGNVYADNLQAIADKEGISVEEVIKQGKDKAALAEVSGMISASLDYLGAGKIVGFLKNAVKNTVKKKAVGLLTTGAVEGATEGAQGLVTQTAKGLATGDMNINMYDIASEALAGTAMGLTFAAPGLAVRDNTRSYTYNGQKINRQKARELIQQGSAEGLKIENDTPLQMEADKAENRKKTIKDEKETPTTKDATEGTEPVQPERKPAERIEPGGITERDIVPEESPDTGTEESGGADVDTPAEARDVRGEQTEQVPERRDRTDEPPASTQSSEIDLTEGVKGEIKTKKDGGVRLTAKRGDKKAGVFNTRVEDREDGKYLRIQEVMVSPSEEGKGIGTQMYRQVMENLPEGVAGLVSPKESRQNETQVPRIHEKLAKEYEMITTEEGDIIFKKPITPNEQVEIKEEVATTPEIEGEAIQTEVAPTAKEEEAEKITIKEKGKQLADRIRTLKIQQEKGVLKSDFTGGLAPAIWNDVVVEGVAQAVEAGATIVEAVDNVIRDLKGRGEKFDEKKLREYWGALPERKGKKEVQAKAEFEAQFQKDISSRQARVQEEKAFKQGMKDLRDQIRLEARAAREGFKLAREEAREIAKVKREEKSDFAKRVAEKIKPLKGRMKASQSKSILNRANKVNVSNPKSVADYIDYVGKVMNDVDYDQKLAQGKKLQGLARKAFKAKSTLVNHKEALDAIRKVPVNKVSDIDEYNRVIGEYLRSFRPVSQGQYQMGNPDTVLDYLGKQRSEIDKSHAERLLEEYEMTVEDFGGNLSAKDILEMIESDKEFDKYAEELDRKKKAAMSDALTNISKYSQMSLDAISTEEMTEADKQDLSKLKDIDTSRLSDNQKKEFIKVVDNVIVNNSFAGSGQIMEAYDAIKGMDEALAARGLIDRVRQLYKLTGKVESLPMMFRTMFGLNDARILIEKAMGQTRLFQAVKAWRDEYQGILDKYKEVTNEARKMDKDAFSEESIYARGMVSNVVQSIPGDDMGNQFADWKAIIDESIDKKSKNRDFKDEAATERIIYDKIIKDASTPAEVIKNFKREYPGSHLVWEFFTKEVHPGYRQRLARNTENFFNQQWEDWNFYNARKYKQYRGADKDIQEEDTFGRLSLSPKQSPHSIRRSRYSSLPADMVLDFDFDKNQLNAIYKNLYDIHTSAPKAQVNNFMKLPEAVQIFDTINNIDIVKKKFDDVYKTLGRQGFVDDAMQQALRRVTSTIRRYAISRALGGFYQLVKQPVSVMFNTAINNNLDIRVMGSGLAQLKRASAIHNMFSIGERGKTRGGTKMADIDDKGGISAKNSMLRRLGVILDYLSEAFLKPLTIADTIAARGSWNIYYLKYLKEKGYDISSIDMAQEASNVLSDPIRLAAAQYAESSIDINQVASEMSKIAEITKTQANVYQNIFRDIFIPFSSFSVEARGRIINDWMDIWAGRNRAQAVKSQVATLGEIAIFNTIKVYMLSWVTQQGIGLLYSMFGIEDEDKSEEEKKAQLAFEFKKFYSSTVRDMIFSGFGQLGENGGIDLINGFAYWAGRIGDMDFVKKKNGEFMTYKGWLKENKMPLYRYDAGELLGSLGLLDVVVNQVTDFGSQMEVLHESDKLTDEQRRLVYFATLAQILQTADMMDVDLYRISQRAQDEMLRENKKRGGGRRGSGTGSSGYGEFDFDLDFANDF